MKLDIKDSVIIVILIVIFLLFAMVNVIWINSLVKRIDEVEKISTYIDDSILDKVERVEQKTANCNC
jgi:hypothetical protein